MKSIGIQKLVHDGRYAACLIIGFAQVFTGRLHVDQQRHVVTDGLPVFDVQLHVDMTGNGVDMNRGVG